VETSKCKVCGGPVKQFLSFGELPLGNAFPRRQDFDAERRFPLELGYCIFCTLVQQISPPPTHNLAEDYRNYRYIPVGDSLRKNLCALGQKIAGEFHLARDSFVVDIGSNDGALLAAIKDRCRVLGVEPARVISQMAIRAGVPTINDFFTHEVANKIISQRGHADVVIATQTLQHIPAIGEFVDDVRSVLKDTGIFVVEGRYLADTIEKASYDTFYHEMLYFSTLRALINLFKQHALWVFRAETVDVYGGSLRVYAKKRLDSSSEIEDSVFQILQSEQDLNLDRFGTYLAFAEKVRRLRDELRGLIVEIRGRGHTIAAYGAPSTSATLLNYCQLGNDLIDYVIDDSPLKQGLFTPGTHIPILDSGTLASRRPEYILVLAWRLKEEIIPKIKKYFQDGSKIILPLPNVQVI